MTLELPSPGQPNDEDSARSQHSRRQSERPRLPSRDEILELLNRIPGMVIMGHLSPSKARVIQQNLQIQLKAQTQRPEVENQVEGSMEALSEALRRDPELAKVLEGFLTDEQVAALLRQNTDAPQ